MTKKRGLLIFIRPLKQLCATDVKIGGGAILGEKSAFTMLRLIRVLSFIVFIPKVA